MGRSLESMSRSHNLDMAKNPEGTTGYANKSQTFEEHMKEVRQWAETKEWIERMSAKQNQPDEKKDAANDEHLTELKAKILEAFGAEKPAPNDERITNCKNRIFEGDNIQYNDNPNVFRTDENSLYRITGIDQIADVINCGYVRPREGKLKGGHENEVFWSHGGSRLNFVDKRPILETSINTIKDGQIGAITLDDLTAVWVFDEESGKRENKLETIKKVKGLMKKGEQVDTEFLQRKIKEGVSLADISATF